MNTDNREPTEPGFYWTRDKQGNDRRSDSPWGVVEITHGGSPRIVRAWFPGSEVEVNPSDLWWGPRVELPESLR